MSVRVGERKEQNFEILTVARQLAVYTIAICANEKCFPKRHRWSLTQRIVTEAQDAYICIKRANTVYVTNKAEYEYRRTQQAEARAHIVAMLALVDVAYTMFHVGSKRVEYWTKLAATTLDKLGGWMRSDKERFKNFA